MAFNGVTAIVIETDEEAAITLFRVIAGRCGGGFNDESRMAGNVPESL
jgi:hypothetical protein